MKISQEEIHRKDKGIIFAQIKTPVHIPALQSSQGFLRRHQTRRLQGGEGPDGQVISIKRADAKKVEMGGGIVGEK